MPAFVGHVCGPDAFCAWPAWGYFERHKWVDMERFILDPLPGAKDELASRPQGDGPRPNPRALSH